MAINGKQCFCLLFVFTASIHTTTALHKRAGDVSTQAVMTLVEQQAAAILRLEAKLTSAETKLTGSETKLTSVEAELNTVKTSLEAMVHQQSRTINHLNTKLSDVNTKLSDVNSSLSVDLNNINTRLDTTVLFTAHMSEEPYTIEDKTPIKFDAVTSNVGGGYNATTGVFTVPVSGVYVVYAQLMKYKDDPFMWWYIQNKSGDYVCVSRVEQLHLRQVVLSSHHEADQGGTSVRTSCFWRSHT
ncbi:uncharacterized protein [Littorina saxatilis]|uniref:uncharacterized protein n=1 Tax=Littorina saxatilis TaxID=31220 RepID=UPI0038B65087